MLNYESICRIMAEYCIISAKLSVIIWNYSLRQIMTHYCIISVKLWLILTSLMLNSSQQRRMFSHLKHLFYHRNAKRIWFSEFISWMGRKKSPVAILNEILPFLPFWNASADEVDHDGTAGPGGFDHLFVIGIDNYVVCGVALFGRFQKVDLYSVLWMFYLFENIFYKPIRLWPNNFRSKISWPQLYFLTVFSGRLFSPLSLFVMSETAKHLIPAWRAAQTS